MKPYSPNSNIIITTYPCIYLYIQQQLLAKELADADNLVLDKMQVTTILNSLPPSWDHIVTTLAHNGKEVTMISLLVLLVLEEERMKRRKTKNQNHNLLMTQTITKSKPPK